MSVNSKIANAFPPHNVSAREKGGKKWGLQGAKAIWFHNDNYAPTLFYNDRAMYETYIKFAFGQQDEDRYKPAVGINAKNQERSFLGGIRWQIKNFATKRVNATVSRIFNKKYDPVATAIDPLSVDRKEDYKSNLKLWTDHKEWLAEAREMTGVDTMPDGMDFDMIPLNDEELEVYMSQDYKLDTEIYLELGVQYHLKRLDWEGVKEKIDFYLTVLPVAAIWCGLDSEGMPVIKTLNPARVLAPRSEFNDYKRLAYCAYVDSYTVAEFKKLVGTELPPEEVQRLVDQFANRNNTYYRKYNPDFPGNDRDVDKIDIMHFEIATVNENVFLEKTDGYGNERFVEKPYEYYQTEKEQEKFAKRYGDTRKIHREPYNTVYGGYWICGSELVFGYGEHNYCGGELGYKLRSSNMHDGRSTSLMKQMIPSLDMLETLDKKIQQLVASAVPKGVFIDLHALRKASFKMDGKDMGPQELLELYFQKGIIIGDTGSGYAPGANQKPIIELNGGISADVINYVNLMKNELEVLDEVIGYNRASSGSTLSPETGARVAQQMEQATDVALDHLYRADRGLTTQAFKALAHLHGVSVLYNPTKYIPIFGENMVQTMMRSTMYEQMGIDVEARPTQAEWNEFYADMEGLVKTGKIEPEDKVALRRCNSLKQAYSLMRVLSRRRKKEMADAQMATVQQTAEVQAQSNTQAHQNAIQLEQAKTGSEVTKTRAEMERDYKLHTYKMEQIALLASLQNKGQLEKVDLEGEYELEATEIIAKSRPKPTTAKK
jgi:hypothetical protein